MDIIKIHSRKIAKKGEIGECVVGQTVTVTGMLNLTAATS
jgi:hypothetical protein